MSDCPTCDLLAEWDEAMIRVRRAPVSRRATAQVRALEVAGRIISGIERHEQEGPAPP
jgi:hypothetical protein